MGGGSNLTRRWLYMSQSKWNPNRRQQPPKKLGPLGVDSETRPSPRSVSESTANDIRTSVKRWLAPSRDAIKVSVSIDDYHRIHDLFRHVAM